MHTKYSETSQAVQNAKVHSTIQRLILAFHRLANNSFLNNYKFTLKKRKPYTLYKVK